MVKRLVVCGLGKLGSPIAACFAKRGLQVIGLDLDESKVKKIQQGLSPVDEPFLEDNIRNVAGTRLTATTDVLEAVRGTQACIFVTATPSLPEGNFDNSFLIKAITKVAGEVDWDAPVVPAEPYLFIIASTVTPGSCDKVFLPLIRGLCKRPFKLIYKPELIALGTVVHDLLYPDFLLIGASDDHGACIARELYSRLVERANVPVKCMSLVEAELAKISLNCAITMKISFANQIAMVAEQMGADPHRILDAVGEDSRIGKRALKPGMPFGGPCFPRDNRMFQYVAIENYVVPYLAIATDNINHDRLKYILKNIPAEGDVGILGLSYKAGTSIREEAPGLMLQELLVKHGRKVKAHDANLGNDSIEDVLACETVVVATAHPEYKELRIPANVKKVIDPMKVLV